LLLHRNRPSSPFPRSRTLPPCQTRPPSPLACAPDAPDQATVAAGVRLRGARPGRHLRSRVLCCVVVKPYRDQGPRLFGRRPFAFPSTKGHGERLLGYRPDRCGPPLSKPANDLLRPD
jgi:hypothetical protein